MYTIFSGMKSFNFGTTREINKYSFINNKAISFCFNVIYNKKNKKNKKKENNNNNNSINKYNNQTNIKSLRDYSTSTSIHSFINNSTLLSIALQCGTPNNINNSSNNNEQINHSININTSNNNYSNNIFEILMLLSIAYGNGKIEKLIFKKYVIEFIGTEKAANKLIYSIDNNLNIPLLPPNFNLEILLFEANKLIESKKKQKKKNIIIK